MPRFHSRVTLLLCIAALTLGLGVCGDARRAGSRVTADEHGRCAPRRRVGRRGAGVRTVTCIPSRLPGQFDLAMSSIGVTLERQKPAVMENRTQVFLERVR